jgi:hypothetical protein
MNLPLELQRRLDRQWFARFGMPERGSRPDPCAVKAQAPAVDFPAQHPALEDSAPQK